MTRGFPILLALVLSIGMAALAFETDGFRVVTSAGARQLAVERQPRAVPDVRLADQQGTVFTLGDYKGRAVLIDFIYTRCPTICGQLGDGLAGVRTLAKKSDTARVALLSISFDPKNDDREALRLYGERFGAKPPQWRIAAPVDAHGLDVLLKSFGVVVIPDGMGGFIHNGAIYLVDAQGRLARILDPVGPRRLLAAALREPAP